MAFCHCAQTCLISLNKLRQMLRLKPYAKIFKRWEIIVFWCYWMVLLKGESLSALFLFRISS